MPAAIRKRARHWADWFSRGDMFSFFGFGRKQTEAEKLAEEKQKQSIQALEAGDIPVRARERLEESVRLGKSFFSSDLNCREYLFTREAGYEVISQVMGSAFVNISFWGGLRTNRSTGEVTSVSQAQLLARNLAITRMQKEATILGATGIVGVRLVMRNYDWSERQVEYTAIGTAIRVPGAEQKEPFTSLLSGQEFWQLHQAGYWPRGICMGVCSYYVWTDQATRNILYNWWGSNNANNAEIKSYTQGFYDARERAMNRLISDIAEHKAEGVIGVRVDQDVQEIEYEVNDRTYHDFLVHFNLMGTAIVKDARFAERKPQSAMVMLDLSSKQTRRLEFDKSDEMTYGEE